AGGDQTAEDGEQLAYVLEVQAGGRFVEDVESAAGVALGELARQLDPLRLAARQRRRRLAERDVAEADVLQRLQDAAQLAVVLEQAHRVGDGGLEDVGDSASLPVSPQRRVVVAPAAADLAGDVDVGQEVHLDLADAVPLAGLAAAAAHVEREAAGLVTVGARL